MAEVLDNEDINDKLPVLKKVKCSGTKKNHRGFLEKGAKCGQVYLRIVANDEYASDIDKLAAKEACPVCGHEEWEQITKYDVSDDGLRVIIKQNTKW